MWQIWGRSSTNGEERPSEKTKLSTEPNLIHSLPDDLFVSCLARVSRLHYPLLSLVSKSFESHIASPELYQTRSLLNRAEKSLYVCLQFPSEVNPRWFTLCKKPNQTLTKKEKEKEVSSGYALAQIRILNYPIVKWTHLIAVGSNLYAIRATEESPPCSNVSYFDCRTHTWLEAPSMRIAHIGSEFDGCLYLPGSSEKQESSSLNCIEVFNTKTQTWTRPIPSNKKLFKLRNLEGKIYTKQRGEKRGVAYKPKESTVEIVELNKISDRISLCVIEDVFYNYSSERGFTWSDLKLDVQRELKGLQGLPKFASYNKVKLVDYGGKMMVLWYKENMVWCAEISLKKRSNGEEIWGKVEWVDAVLKVPMFYKFVYAISATV